MGYGTVLSCGHQECWEKNMERSIRTLPLPCYSEKAVIPAPKKCAHCRYEAAIPNSEYCLLDSQLHGDDK